MHKRSEEGRKRKLEQKTLNRKKKAKALVEEKLNAEKKKEAAFQELKSELDRIYHQKNLLQQVVFNQKKQTTCQYIGKYFAGTQVTSSKRFKVRKALLDYLPTTPAFINEGMIRPHECTKSWKGVFGCVTLINMPSVTKETLAMKTVSLELLKGEEILCEAKVMHTLSGHSCFPWIYGILKPNKIVMQYLGRFEDDNAIVDTVNSILGRKIVNSKQWLQYTNQILRAVSFMHDCMILHNDIKGDNVVLLQHLHLVKIIDFGKATHISNPAVYNLKDTSREKYNRDHRYLAWELRNKPNTKQSVLTDTYSLGYLIKYIGYYENISVLHELGRSMKCIDALQRTSIKEAIEKTCTEI